MIFFTVSGWSSTELLNNSNRRNTEKEIKVVPDSTTNHPANSTTSSASSSSESCPGFQQMAVISNSPRAASPSVQVKPGISHFTPFSNQNNKSWSSNQSQSSSENCTKHQGTPWGNDEQKHCHLKQSPDKPADNKILSPSSVPPSSPFTSSSPHQITSKSPSQNLDSNPLTPRPSPARCGSTPPSLSPCNQSGWMTPDQLETPSWDFSSPSTPAAQNPVPSPTNASPFRIPKGRPLSRTSNLHSNPLTPQSPMSDTPVSSPTFVKPFPPIDNKQSDNQHFLGNYDSNHSNNILNKRSDIRSSNGNTNFDSLNKHKILTSPGKKIDSNSESMNQISHNSLCGQNDPLHKIKHGDTGNNNESNQSINSINKSWHSISGVNNLTSIPKLNTQNSTKDDAASIKEEPLSSNSWASLEDVKQLSDYHSTMFGTGTTNSNHPFVSPLNSTSYGYPSIPGYPGYSDTKPYQSWADPNVYGTHYPQYPHQTPGMEFNAQYYAKREESSVYTGSLPYRYQVQI